MIRNIGFWERLKTDISVGLFLAKREIKRASLWTTSLIIFVMLLTFLNLVVIGGILVGLIEGSVAANKNRNTGDIFITAFLNRENIEQSDTVIKTIQNLPNLENYTARYTGGGTVVADYKKTLLNNEKENSVGAALVGINPVEENEVTGISNVLIEGEYLDNNDSDFIMIGSNLLYKYTPIEFPGFSALKNVETGSKVLLKIGDISKEYTIKGVFKGKVDSVDSRVVMLDTELRKLLGRDNYDVNEIAVKLLPGSDPVFAQQALVTSGIDKYGRIQTAEEAQPKFLQDIKVTFAILGNAISSIGLVVAAITIFIVIFVNAITRRRYIGILKGIGITPRAIVISYIIQSIFYAISGAILGIIVVFALLKPFFASHPIDFPFSDGILVATVGGTITRTIILAMATIIAGYIPARIVIKQNTLSAILGR
jgi:putative ABC transport system permease protein